MKKSNPLVSVIVPTRNSAQFLDACLTSIKKQSYKNIEIIVVDNNSTDSTKEIVRSVIARSEATWQSRIFLFNKVPERITESNFGAKIATGEYFLFIESDIELSPKVIEACVNKILSTVKTVALVIPEKSIGIGFWAKCKALEKSFYVGVDLIEASRFFLKGSYLEVGGYDESLVSGEDWDLSQRIEKLGKIERIQEYILHNEGHFTLKKALLKKYYYAQNFSKYLSKKRPSEKTLHQTNPFLRFNLFFKNSNKLFNEPFLGLGMLFMKVSEFCFGGVGYVIEKLKKYEK